MQYLVDVDLNKNELKNAVLQPLTEAPKNPKVGQIYTDVSGEEAHLMWYNGKEWIPLDYSAPAVPEVQPTKVEPSVTLSVPDVDTSGMEVGMTVPISYSAKFNPGSYAYGPETGVVVESWKIYDTNEPPNVSTEPSGTFAEVTVGDNTAYKIIAEATHSAGSIPVGDQGNPYPAVQIQAGKKTASTGSIAGYRKYFYGAPKDILDLTSDSIRSLTHSTTPISDGTQFDLKLAEGTNQVIIAFPSNAGLSLTSVIDTGAFNIDVYDIFKKETVEVEGANGYDAISYDAYVYTPDVSLSKNTYKVTISREE